MTNLVPGVVWRPIDHRGLPQRRKGRGLVGHVAVSGSKDLRPSGGNSWHFYLPKAGPAIQYIDLDYQCGATYEGNGSLAAFESEGGLGSSAQVNAEPWTDNQLDWAARILLHMHDTEGVPLRVMASSLPGERGFGTHRLGIDPWRVPAGELWSRHSGKECPGDKKHEQRFEVVRRAAAMAGAEIMAKLDPDDYQKIAQAVWGYNLGATKGGTGDDPISLPAESARDRVNAIRRAGVAVRDRVKQLLDGGTPPPA